MKRTGFGIIAAAVAWFYLAAVIASHAQTFSTLVEFNSTDGAYPYLGSLVQGTDGNLYGTTLSGGNGTQCTKFGCGTVFRMTATGHLSTVYRFCSQTNCIDGGGPAAGLILGANAEFYGTTQGGGAYGAGTVFEITPNGKLTTLHSFCGQGGTCPDGATPRGGLIQGVNGNFYGTTLAGGAYDSGTVFEITQSGKLTTLHRFCASGYPCADGEQPYAALVQGKDGSFYGTTVFGGRNEYGTVFKITRTGRFTTLYDFCSIEGCADGAYPYGALMLKTDGNFYGTTYEGGATSWGSVFEITPSGILTTLYNFGPCNSGCPDGANPLAGLVQGSDSNFYGTTQMGGLLANLCGGIFTAGCGVSFQVTSAGQFTLLHDFCSLSNCADGFSPEGELFQATNGGFYGTATSGGDTTGTCAASGCGTVYSISVGLPSFVDANPYVGKVGGVISILGNNLTNTMSVAFNATPAAFKVISGTYLKAEVPAGASSGLIQVTTPSGTLSSRLPFHIIP